MVSKIFEGMKDKRLKDSKEQRIKQSMHFAQTEICFTPLEGYRIRGKNESKSRKTENKKSNGYTTSSKNPTIQIAIVTPVTFTFR